MVAAPSCGRKSGGAENGRSSPLRCGAGRIWLIARIAEKPDLTLRALLAELADRGLVVSYYALWHFLQHEGVTFKKRMARPVCKGVCRDWLLIQSASTYPASRSFLRP